MSVLSIISIIVLVICLIVGIVRGIVKTLLRLCAAVGTALLSVFVTPYLAKALTSSSVLKNVHPSILSGISALIIVILASLVFGLIIFVVNKRVSDSALSSTNRLLGGLFYVFIGFVFLILLGYVINIFRDASFMQSIIADSKKDVFANWLVTNNLFNKFMQAVAKEGGVFWQFINGFRIPTGGGSSPSGDAGSGNVTAAVIGAIARI